MEFDSRPLSEWLRDAWRMSDAALAQDAGRRFDHVLIDEYQDTNRL